MEFVLSTREVEARVWISLWSGALVDSVLCLAVGPPAPPSGFVVEEERVPHPPDTVHGAIICGTGMEWSPRDPWAGALGVDKEVPRWIKQIWHGAVPKIRTLNPECIIQEFSKPTAEDTQEAGIRLTRAVSPQV